MLFPIIIKLNIYLLIYMLSMSLCYLKTFADTFNYYNALKSAFQLKLKVI